MPYDENEFTSGEKVVKCDFPDQEGSCFEPISLKKYNITPELENLLENQEVEHPNAENNIININIPHFREKVIEHLENIYRSIVGTAKQKDIIWSKSIEILDEFILRAKNNEFTIPKNANLRKIAITIIYTVIISNENMPKINVPHPVYQYYQRYFSQLYPRGNFLFNSPLHNFKKIRNMISLYFFEILKDKEIETSELVCCLKKKILANINLPLLITREEIDVLTKMINDYQDTFIEYFSHLAETLKQLIKSCRIHKEIGAILVVKYIADFLDDKGINLLQKSTVFYQSLIEIYDYLKESFPNFFPVRSRTHKNLSKEEKLKKHNDYRKIVAFKLKIYLIRYIHDGKYFKDVKGQCPECLKEGLVINTDISRLKALEFHHSSEDKEAWFSSEKLYARFIEDQSNPNFLEDLIKLAESENVILLCRNHHFLLHDKFFGYFKYLIDYDRLFSLSPELIHLLVRVSVDNFYLTKDLSVVDKKNIRRCIVRYLKKRYILERFYGDYCHICGEFSVKNHLSAYIFHHLNENTRTLLASSLYNKYSCSEIVSILEQEKGGYICANCHTIYHYKFNHLLDKIFEDELIAEKVLDDYFNAIKKFTYIDNNSSLIREPLKKSIVIDESVERYLTAIYNLTELGYEVTTKNLLSYLGLNPASHSNIHKFMQRKGEFLEPYLIVIKGSSHCSTKIILTEDGKELVKLINHFKDYYSSL